MPIEKRHHPERPPDTISQADNVFQGQAYVFAGIPERLQIQEIKFRTRRGEEPLPDFFYNKPHENPENPFLPPIKIENETKARSGYFPVAFVLQARRDPNHLYEDADAFVMVRNFGTDDNPKWETRYFPVTSIDENTINNAKVYLEKYSVQN